MAAVKGISVDLFHPVICGRGFLVSGFLALGSQVKGPCP